jgi:putative transposase
VRRCWHGLDLESASKRAYTWRRQDRIDRGLQPGVTSIEKACLTTAKLGSPNWRPSGPLPPGHRAARRYAPQRRFKAIVVMVGELLLVRLAFGLKVPRSGYCEWRGRSLPTGDPARVVADKAETCPELPGERAGMTHD